MNSVLIAAGFDPGARYRVTVATNEAVSNALEHGEPCDDGRIHLAAAVEHGSFVFTVRDCGEFEHATPPEPDAVAERGRGFAFMNLLMDDVQLEARPGETVLRLAKWLPGTPPPPHDVEAAGGEDNIRVVRALFAAFGSRELAPLLELIDRGVMMEPLSTPVGRRTPYLGIAGLRRYLRDLDETWEQFQVTLEDVRAQGSHVVARGRIRARRGSFVGDDPAGFAFKLRDRKVVWAKVYRSYDEALAAAGLA